MVKRSFAPLLLWPLGLYLAAMVVLAAFVTHPPLVGWLGLAALGTVLLALGVGFAAFLSRMRTNAPRLHPHERFVHRVLVVLDADPEPEELVAAVRLRTLGRHAEVRIVAPVMASPLHFVLDDEDRERARSRERLQEALRVLAAEGIVAQGAVGPDDPLQALGDELTRFRADEVVLVTVPPGRRSWLDRSFEREARDRFGVHVSTLHGIAESRCEQALPV